MNRRGIAAAVLAFVLAAAPAAAESWTGWITDEHCGAAGAKAEHKDCAEKCHKSGIPLAFYNDADQKVYKIDDQKTAEQHLGHPVKVTGTLEGETIKVAKIEAVESN